MASKREQGLKAVLLALVISAATLAAPLVSAGDAQKNKKAAASKALKGLPVTQLSEDEAILHALNRLGYGPRPGDMERVRQLGLEKWINEQLDPNSIPDRDLDARLDKFPTLAMSSEKLLEEFPQANQAARLAGLTPQQAQQQREALQKQREEMQQRQAEQMEPGEPAQEMDRSKGGKNLGLGKQGQAGDPAMARLNYQDVRTPQRIIAELSMAKLTRAIYSERQLYEQMVDFWFNHFNVFAAKGADRWLITSYERDAIRPHAMGKFRDLLYATAKSPAMLFYLDNWMSADPKAFDRMQSQMMQRRQRIYALYGMRDPLYTGMGRRPGQLGQNRFPQQGQPGQAQQQQRQRRGLNENYARELMELHTLGVDGGYTQDDVIEVAKCFTGWTLGAPRRNPEFHFEERIHDGSAKTVLGHKIHAGGMKDGEEVLDLLARHPNTAKFISTKLARQFVSDNPPPALVDRMAKTFLDTDGDIKSVLRAMIDSPEFWSRETYRAKIKKPFELVASAARALGTDVQVPLPLVMWTARIGEPLYMCQPPTGYSPKAETWVNTGALLNRLNYSVQLASNRMRGARTDAALLLGVEDAANPKDALNNAIQTLLAGQVSKQTRDTLEKQLADPQILQASLDDPVKQVDVGTIAGLVLGAPEFQRR